MKQLVIGLTLLFVACSAGAQMYKWVDQDGKVHFGDTPPPGAKTTTVRAPSSGEAPAAAPAAGKDAKKGPLTPAEQEQEYRKRQADERKAAEKADADRRAKAALADDCARTREYLATLESGARIQRSNTSGERYYLDDAEIQQEIAKARQSLQACKQ